MGAYDRLINTLTTDPLDQARLRALAAGMEAHPTLASRAEAILRELARPPAWPDGSEMSPQQCSAYCVDFLFTIGVPSGLISPLLELMDDASLDDVSTERIEDEAVVAHLEQAMKDDPAGYLKNPHAQKEYAAALERLNAPPPPGKGPTDWERQRDAERCAVIERDYMRAEPGSPEWKEYWRGPLQQELAEILERQVAPVAMPEPEPERPAQ